MYTRKDKNRLFLKNELRIHGIYINSKESFRFTNFLLDPGNSDYLQSFLLLCSGSLKDTDSKPRINELLAEFDFQKDGYSYTQLFNLDADWYQFYKENAMSNGIRKARENRRGVQKRYVNDVMLIRRLLDMELFDSIVLKVQLDHKNFCVNNNINPDGITPDTNIDINIDTETESIRTE